MDLSGTSRINTSNGKLYFMLIIDYYNRLISVASFREKSKYFEKFKVFKAMAENETHCKLKRIRYDNGGELTFK